MQATFSSGANYFQPVKYDPGSYLWATPEVFARKRQYQFGSGPNVDGQYGIDFGFRSQKVKMRVLYVSNTAEAVLALWTTDMEAMSAAPFDAVCGGKTFKFCTLDEDGTVNTDVIKVLNPNGGGGITEAYVIWAIIMFDSRNLN